jgi:hypothetical protein
MMHTGNSGGAGACDQVPHDAQSHDWRNPGDPGPDTAFAGSQPRLEPSSRQGVPRRQLRHYKARLPQRVLVVAMAAVVYCAPILSANVVRAAPPVNAAAAPTNATLPPAVAEMRDAILAAVHSGRIDDLRLAIELNEMRPEVADDAVDDIVAYWRSSSKDGEGRDILEVLGKILDQPPAVVPLGRDIENNRIFVWPALAERAPVTLTAADDGALASLMSTQEAQTLKSAERWTWWRLAIGADGTWHSFRREK